MARAQTVDREELVPEADRVEGFLHPRENTQLIGHEQAERELLDAVRSGQLHHAWLLAGPRGIGKATLAYRMARFLLARDIGGDGGPVEGLGVSPDQAIFRHVAALSHPGLLVLRRPWQAKTKRHANAITVDEARRLRGFLGQTASDGGWRVVIIDSADDLNISAANAVLKSLEEPPKNCIFLLVSSTPGRLPVTIRSRCRVLRLSPLSEAAMGEALERAFEASGSALPDAASFERCVSLAQGSPGSALRLLAGDGIALHEELLDILDRMPRPDFGRIHDLAASLAGTQQEERYHLFHTTLSNILSRMVMQAAGRSEALDEREVALAERLIDADALAQWAGLWETLQREKTQADVLNLDRKTLVLECFFRIEALSRKQ